MKNDIPVKQNEQKELQRLAAQRELYSSAKRIFNLQTILTLIIPVLFAGIAIAYDKLAPYIALYGVIIFAADLLLIDPEIKVRKIKAAKIQEMFDCGVFGLNYSPLKTVSDINVEEVLRNYEAHQKIASNIEKIKNWYPAVVGNVELPVARIICQRSSCWWDKKLRDSYCKRIKFLVLGIISLIVIGCFLKQTGIIQVVLILSALIPFFQFAIKQYKDNMDMNCRLEQLSCYITNVWNNIIAGNLTNEQLEIESRRIQDGIYDNRTLSPLIYDFFYKKFRSKDELTMNRAAEILVEEFEARKKGK